MDSNARWHRSDCNKPNIVVEDGVPRCHTCGATSSVLVAQLIAQSHAKGGDIHPPVEAPLGETKLWWPPCVRYCSPPVNNGGDKECCDDKDNPIGLFEQESERSSESSIYPSRLDSSHFRLICITGSECFSSPIHIVLDEYHFHDHPEYETVSYVWGGEDANYTPSKPIYVGHFWDVILATSNCSALMHYLRHRNACRIIWLDAICINQADNVEKQAQISRMGDIYTNCERVVAYLGQDVVSQPQRRTFRPRKDFQKSKFTESASKDSEDFLDTCAQSAGLSPSKLLERRYLTRIWIVQEIMLSRTVLFPLGDFDIICCPETAMRLILRTTHERLLTSLSTGRSPIF